MEDGLAPDAVLRALLAVARGRGRAPRAGAGAQDGADEAARALMPSGVLPLTPSDLVVRRRLQVRVTAAVLRDEQPATVTVTELHVSGTCSLEEAEALNLEPEELEEAVDAVAEAAREAGLLAAGVPVETALAIRIPRIAPAVFTMAGDQVPLLGGPLKDRVVLVALWASWSPQSLQVLRAADAWVRQWDDAVQLAAVAVDDTLEQVPDLDDHLKAQHRFFWAGLGDEGSWTRSPVARALALESVPALAVVDFDGQPRAEALFLTEEDFAADPAALPPLLEAEGRRLGAAINSLLASRPAPAPEPTAPPSQDRGWRAAAERALLESDAARVTVDQLYHRDGSRRTVLVQAEPWPASPPQPVSL